MLNKLKYYIIKKYPFLELYFKNFPLKIQQMIIDRSLMYCTYINNPHEIIQLQVIKNNPYFIDFIKHPSNKVIETTVKLHPHGIKAVVETEELQLLAFEYHGFLCVEYMKNPSYNVQLSALYNDKNTIFMLDNFNLLHPDIKLLAIMMGHIK
jgi:hypothetical protein